jgi:RNA polymerase sigma-70 factor (ECF subfamily)
MQTESLAGMAASCPEALTDQELMLVLGGMEGNESRDDLFGEIFRRYQGRVTAWCYRITRDRSRALDLAQEIFLKAFRHIRSFRGDARLSTWLYAITRNHCLSSIKKRSADPAELAEEMPRGLRDLTVELDRDIDRAQASQRMWEMIHATLEPMEARVMTLHYGYEIPLATITQKLALSNPSGAKAYVVNARRKLNHAIRRRAQNGASIEAASPSVASRGRASRMGPSGPANGLTGDFGKSAA